MLSRTNTTLSLCLTCLTVLVLPLPITLASWRHNLSAEPLCVSFVLPHLGAGAVSHDMVAFCVDPTNKRLHYVGLMLHSTLHSVDCIFWWVAWITFFINPSVLTWLRNGLLIVRVNLWAYIGGPSPHTRVTSVKSRTSSHYLEILIPYLSRCCLVNS